MRELLPLGWIPEEPEGWFGQGELDLVAPAHADREAKTDAGSGPPAAGGESEGSGTPNDAPPEAGDALLPEGAAPAVSPPADEKSAPTPPPEPARAPLEAGDGDGLIRL